MTENSDLHRRAQQEVLEAAGDLLSLGPWDSGIYAPGEWIFSTFPDGDELLVEQTPNGMLAVCPGLDSVDIRLHQKVARERGCGQARREWLDKALEAFLVNPDPEPGNQAVRPAGGPFTAEFDVSIEDMRRVARALRRAAAEVREATSSGSVRTLEYHPPVRSSLAPAGVREGFFEAVDATGLDAGGCEFVVYVSGGGEQANFGWLGAAPDGGPEIIGFLGEKFFFGAGELALKSRDFGLAEFCNSAGVIDGTAVTGRTVPEAGIPALDSFEDELRAVLADVIRARTILADGLEEDYPEWAGFIGELDEVVSSPFFAGQCAALVLSHPLYKLIPSEELAGLAFNEAVEEAARICMEGPEESR